MLLLLLVACAARAPRDLEDALARIDARVTDEDRALLRSGERNAIDMHFGLGMAIRNEWHLWGRSRLVRWFRGVGITHPDDMSSILLDSYVRELRGEPVDLEGQIAEKQAYWAERE